MQGTVVLRLGFVKHATHDGICAILPNIVKQSQFLADLPSFYHVWAANVILFITSVRLQLFCLTYNNFLVILPSYASAFLNCRLHVHYTLVTNLHLHLEIHIFLLLYSLRLRPIHPTFPNIPQTQWSQFRKH